MVRACVFVLCALGIALSVSGTDPYVLRGTDPYVLRVSGTDPYVLRVETDDPDSTVRASASH